MKRDRRPETRESKEMSDKKEKIVGIVLTQLLPAGTYPQRVLMHNAVYAAVSKSYAE